MKWNTSMRRVHTLPLYRTQEHGVALVVVLAILVLMTIVVVGFTVSMRLERQVASVSSDIRRAELLANSAVAHATAILSSNIPEPTLLAFSHATAPAQLWYSNPGRLTLVSEGRTVDLHSGAATSLDPVESVDLNSPMADNSPPITFASDVSGKPDPNSPPPVMRVKWINILKDPTQAATATNPIIGRYGFWVDDESTRINFNTAYGKPANILSLNPNDISPGFRVGPTGLNMVGFRPYTLGHLPSINLDVLSPSWIPVDVNGTNLAQSVWLNGAFKSPDAIVPFAPGASTAERLDWYQSYKYHLTHYSRSPEFNAFGLARIFPVSQPFALEIGPQYQFPINVGLNPHNWVVLGSNNGGGAVSKPSLDKARSIFTAYLERTDWPGYNSSFAAKLDELAPGTSSDAVDQLALDLVAMMRFGNLNVAAGSSVANNSNAFLSAWSGSVATLLNTSGAPPNNPNDFLATLRSGKRALPQNFPPYLNEIVITFIAVPVANPNPTGEFYIQFKVQGEIYNTQNGPRLTPSPALAGDVNKQFSRLGQNLQLRMARLQLDAVNPADGSTKSLNITETANPRWHVGRLAGYAGFLRNPIGNPSLYEVIDFPVSWNDSASGSDYFGAYIPAAANSEFPKVNNGSPGDDPLPRLAPQQGQAAIFKAGSTSVVGINGKIRLGLCLPVQARPLAVVPLAPNTTLDFSVALDLSEPNPSVTVSFEIEDYRLYGLASNWVQTTAPTLGAVNSNQNNLASLGSKAIYLTQGPFSTPQYRSSDEFSNFGFSSIGLLSLLSTGIQSNTKWKSLNFGAGATGTLPDWLLLDLIAPNFRATNSQWASGGGTDPLELNRTPDKWTSASFMTSTAGRVNMNTRIYPNNSYFNAPTRSFGIKAVFKNLISDTDLNSLSSSWEAYQTDTRGFSYIGEAVNVPGFISGSGDLERESLLRNMASCLTTQSNTFGVWGAAQSVKKKPGNTNYGAFEQGDIVSAETRFYFLIERSIWPGIDGVPGNASVNASGSYDKLASPIIGNYAKALGALPGSAPTLNAPVSDLNWSPIDGPTAVTPGIGGNMVPSTSSLEQSLNPADPLTHYRRVFFRYLED